MEKNEVIINALEKGISYQTYRELVKELIAKKQSTSKDGSHSLYEYSVLNDKRMDRLDKKAMLAEQVIQAIQQIEQDQTWLVITEGWCGDAAQNLPYINKLAEQSTNVDLKIVLIDENIELMNLFLTDGNQAIPKLIALDKNNHVLFTWGPRPSVATEMVRTFKQAHGKLTPEFKKDLQVWYNKNKGESLFEDFVGLINERYSTERV